MPRPLTRQQADQNTAFLRTLRATGNVRLAAREAGLKYATMQHRRGKHPGFAQRWDAALATARARLHEAGVQGPGAATGVHPVTSNLAGGEAGRPAAALRTVGGETIVVRTRGARLQVRRAQPGKLTRACEQAFLLALSATANVSLAAAAAGASFGAFNRRRKQNPAFAREMQAALAKGYEAVEDALLASWSPLGREHDAWRGNTPPPIPPMTANQALQLMYLHQKEARFHAERRDMLQRPGERRDAHAARLGRRYMIQLAEEAEHHLLDEVIDNEAHRHVRHDEPPIPPLPDLAQVTGWSRADPNKRRADENLALFGGFRLEHLTEEQKALGKERLRKRRGQARVRRV